MYRSDGNWNTHTIWWYPTGNSLKAVMMFGSIQGRRIVTAWGLNTYLVSGFFRLFYYCLLVVIVLFASNCYYYYYYYYYYHHHQSVNACVRGSRTPFRSKIEQSLDCKINVASADIWNTCLYAFTLRAFYGHWFSRH